MTFARTAAIADSKPGILFQLIGLAFMLVLLILFTRTMRRVADSRGEDKEKGEADPIDC